MTYCININSVQYRELKRLSILPEILLKAEIARYQENHNGRFPTIDELPGANSLNALEQDLNIKKGGTSKIEDILAFTGKQSLSEANIAINDKYRDLDVELVQLNRTALVNVKSRPSMFKHVKSPKNDFNFVDSTIFITQSLDKLAKTMGITINSTSIAQMHKDGILDIIPEASTAQAFIYNNNVFINTDMASIHSKTHELLHILLGSMRFKMPNLYSSIVESMQQLPNIQTLLTQYLNRTLSDALEEIFVEEFSKYLTGADNFITNLDSDIIYQIHYNINRMLDTILMGDNSVSAMSQDVLYNSSLKEVAEIVNSSTMVNTAHGFLNDALIHRTLANVKQELLENGDLKEIC